MNARFPSAQTAISSNRIPCPASSGSGHHLMTQLLITNAHYQYQSMSVVFDLYMGSSHCVLTCSPINSPAVDDDFDDDLNALDERVDSHFEAAYTNKEISLSPRELEIAHLIGRGYKTRFIALALNISVHTVSTYIRRIFTKMNVHTRAEMIACLGNLTE